MARGVVSLRVLAHTAASTSALTLLLRTQAPPDAIVTERIDESLLSEGMVPQLRAAVSALGGKPPKHILPARASIFAVACQLGFEDVPGFGMDGLGIDLRHFDALRPSGAVAAQHPGYWPVRLLQARQPHVRLSEQFNVGEVSPAHPSLANAAWSPLLAICCATRLPHAILKVCPLLDAYLDARPFAAGLS